MKPPIDFGNKFFFRVVFPGTVIAAACARATQTVLQHYGVKIPIEYALPVEIFIFGWAFVVLDMPIYMAFEGRRFWPATLWAFGLRRERGRLARLHRGMRRYDTSRLIGRPERRERENADRLYLEAAVMLSGFPLDRPTSAPKVMWPTRLGNLIAAYEQYPRLKYGLDAVFFWPRLWVSIDKDLRDEIDNQQAQADGLVYLVMALALACVILFAYAIMDRIAPGALMYAQDPSWEVVAAVLCFCAAALIHRLSLYSHAQFGELFKSVFDQHRSILDTDEVVELIENLTGDPGLHSRIGILRNVAVWRLLRWHTVRPPAGTTNRKVRLP